MAIVIFLWFVSGGLGAMLAGTKGLSFVGGFMGMFFLGPISLLSILMAPASQDTLETRSSQTAKLKPRR